MSKMKPKKKAAPCSFCKSSIDDEMRFGKFYVSNDLAVHNFCLLFASGLSQNGKTDNDGIAGFLLKDIKKEMIRGKRLRCSFCKATGATVGCCKPACKKVFHFSCGLKKNTLHQFFGGFMSYCQNHRPKRIIPSDFSSVPDEVSCAICYSPVYTKISENSLWTSCCKNGWFHKTSIQRQAMSAGYFFRCPLCNNTDAFQKQMEYHGIYIPQQDASWELEANAYQDLLFRHSQCDAVVCICPKGRKYHKKSSPWSLIRCVDCGSQGRHIRCENLVQKPKWKCEQCTEVTQRLKKKEEEKVKTSSSKQTAVELSYSENIPRIIKSSTLFCNGEISCTEVTECLRKEEKKKKKVKTRSSKPTDVELSYSENIPKIIKSSAPFSNGEISCTGVTKQLKKEEEKEKVKTHSCKLTALELSNSGNLPIEKPSASFPKGEVLSALFPTDEKSSLITASENTCVKPESIPCFSHAINKNSLPKPVLESPAKINFVQCKNDNISPSRVEVCAITCSEIEDEGISQRVQSASLGLETNIFGTELVSPSQNSKIFLLGEGSNVNRTFSNLTCGEENKVLKPLSSLHVIENRPPVREKPIQQISAETNVENKHKSCTLKKKDSVEIVGIPPAALSSSTNPFTLATCRSSDLTDRAAPLNKLRKRAILEEEQNKVIKKQKLNNSSRRARLSINSKLKKNSYLCIKALFGKPCDCCGDKVGAVPGKLPVNSQHTKCSSSSCAGKFAIEVMKCVPDCPNTNQAPRVSSSSDSTQMYTLGLEKSSCGYRSDNALTKKESTPQKKYSSKYKIDLISSVPPSSTSKG